MKLQTEIKLKKADNQIGYNSQLFLLGSCFAENIGEKLDYFKFRNLQNPYGILFHPVAIEQLVSGAVREESYSKEDIFQHDGLWHCFDAHSELSEASSENLIASLNNGLQATRVQITKASHIIITLGTAWVYRHQESGGIVANCHKVPQNQFSKELLSITEIADSLGRTKKLLRSVNESIQIIFTVSPIRHLKDGFVENQRSKANLIAAVHEVLPDSESSQAKERGQSDSNPSAWGIIAQAAYFPSYEIVMDELRDYRFYKRDMVHPNELAIDYIWEKFKIVWISEKTAPTMEKVNEIQKGLRHRPFRPNFVQHEKFRESLSAKMTDLESAYPFMTF